MFTGDTFVFQVGDSHNFSIHKSLVARKSKVLEAKMEDERHYMSKRKASIADTDARTFGRFVEFVYTGDYNPALPLQPNMDQTSDYQGNHEVPEPVDDTLDSDLLVAAPQERKIEESVAIPEEAAPTEFAGEDRWSNVAQSSFKKKSKRRRSTKLINTPEAVDKTADLFAPISPDDISSPTTTIDVTSTISTASEIMRSADWTLDYLPLLLSHAELYVFAKAYEIRDLQKLTARRLDEALEAFEFSTPCATNIASLVEYVYQPTLEMDVDTGILKTIVVNFIARNVQSLIHSESFKTLIEKGGSLGLEILQKTVCRLS